MIVSRVPVVLFPVAIMVALVFTLIARRGRRASRRKASSSEGSVSSPIDVPMEDIPAEASPSIPSAEEHLESQAPVTPNDDDTRGDSKDSRLADLEAENNRLREENLKLKARGQKKAENLAGYRDGNKSIRMAARKRRQSKRVSPSAGPATDGRQQRAQEQALWQAEGQER